jgi:hypothetical protein
MKCYRHREDEAVGVCVACGKGLCAELCSHESDLGIHCDEPCAERSRKRHAASIPATVGWLWSWLLVALGVVLLYFGYRHSEFTMSVPNLLGMLFVWYGVVLLLQRSVHRPSGSAPTS